MSRWPRIAFCIIWGVSAFAFAILAYEAYNTYNITFSRFPLKLPEFGGVVFNGLDLTKHITAGMTKVFTEMATANNNNVDILEKSIRQSASTSFWLNLMSCIAAIVGFMSQVSIYRQKDRTHDK